MPADVAFLSTGLDLGGAEAQLVGLATRLQARGWDVGVISMIRPAALGDELRAAGVPVASLGMRRGVPDPRGLLRLASLLRAWRPRILHTHMVHANLLGRVARLLYRVPVLVSTAHGVEEGGRWREWGYRLTDWLCDVTTHVSRAGADRYVRVGAVPAHKVLVVPNGVDTDRFRPDPAARERLRSQLGVGSRFVWLAVGRLEPVKDFPSLLQAFAHLRRDGHDPVLWLVGDGPEAPRLRAEARELRVEGAVRFWGVRRDVPALMSAADALALPSRSEGQPLVLLEAAACGLPVVATDVGGVREVVEDGRTGFLVPPGDPEALAGAMARLMALPPPRRAAMGQAARGYVEARYALERVVDRWEALYRDLLRRREVAG